MLKATFHSYKGGACRTSTCFNTLPFLVEKLGATPDRPLLVIDTDLESQGLTYLFGAAQTFRSKNRPYDTKELLSGNALTNYREKCIPVGDKLGVENEAVWFLGVDDTKPFAAQVQGGQVQEKLAMLENQPFCGVIYDTASGDQFSATVTNKDSQVIVCCMRPTRQFGMGTFSFLSRVGKDWITMGDYQIRRVIVLPTAVPRTSITINGDDQYTAVKNRIRKDIEAFDWTVCDEFVQDGCFGIPEVERFKWREDVLYVLNEEGKIKGEADALLALERYEKLAEVIIEEGKKADE